jgi:hypothetical protein
MENIKLKLNGGTNITPILSPEEKARRERMGILAQFIGKLGVGYASNDMLGALVMVIGGLLGNTCPNELMISQASTAIGNDIRAHASAMFQQIAAMKKQQEVIDQKAGTA